MKDQNDINVADNHLTVKTVELAIDDYIRWMTIKGYSANTCRRHKNELKKFLQFIAESGIGGDEIFTYDTLKLFENQRRTAPATAVKRLSRYLFDQKRIHRPIQPPVRALPEVYEQYFIYHRKSRQADDRRIKHIRRVLAPFHDYLDREGIELSSLTIAHIDAFLSVFNAAYAPQTCKLYRSYLRGFLSYLYHERKMTKRDLAPLVVSAPLFARAKPPMFLRPHEVKRLYDCMDIDSPAGLRTYAMLELAYNLGLRPKEICRITLDDISFGDGELTLTERKNTIPVKLPLPESTLKAIAAYIIGARPECDHRELFLGLCTPHDPVGPQVVSQHIKVYMRKADLPSSVYWLRHTYAQNLLEAGASVYEIKEMLGHDSIESTRKYLHIHIKLMRKVLFDEDL
jgi:site-specific recombinase XerD